MGRTRTLNCLMVLGAIVSTANLSARAADWTGNGLNTLWSTPANWAENAVPDPATSLVFRRSDVANRTATLDGMYSYEGNIHMGAGSSADNPYIFEATDPANGLTIKDDIWFGYFEDGWLWIKSGTYEFSSRDTKNFHLGEAWGTTHNFWLRVGDGASDVSMTSKGNGYVRGGSALIADNATIDFTDMRFEQYDASSLYFTNSTMTTQFFLLYNASSATFSDSTLTASSQWRIDGESKFIADNATLTFNDLEQWNKSSSYFTNTAVNVQNFILCDTSSSVFSNSVLTVGRDVYVAIHTGNHCTLKGVSGAINLTNSGCVFNVGTGANATGIVEKDGGDWDCYYLRLGTGTGSTGNFTMNGGKLRVRTEFGLGKGDNSTGAFYLNGGTVKARRILVNGTASSMLVIDGGTLQADGTSGAWVDSPIDISIGANGGTIHTDGGSVVVSPAVNSVENTAGVLTVTGGGSARFAAVGNVATLVVGEDTEVHWFDGDAVVTSYTLDSLTLGAGSTFALDVDASGCDIVTAATANISATAEKKVTLKLVVRAMPESGRAFPLLAMAEADAVNCDVVAETPAGARLTVEKGWANGFLTYAIFAKDYVWNGGSNGGGWTNGGAMWLVDGVAFAWDDNNNAVFASAGDVATLDADARVVSLDFRANATVNAAANSGASISTPEVIVAPGVTAAVNAPFSSAFKKEGKGTLALGANCTENATIADGTLELAGTFSLDWSKLTLGEHPGKPVTFRVGPDATLENIQDSWFIGNVENVTSTVVKTGGDWTKGNIYVANAASAVTTFVQEGGTLTIDGTVDLGRDISAAHAHFDIAGGTVYHSGYIHMGASSPATMTVRKGAKYEVTSPQGFGLIVSGSARGTLNVQGGEVLLTGPLNLCFRGGDAEVNVTDGGTVAFTKALLNSGNGSSGTAVVMLDGGTLRANEDSSEFMPNNARLSVAVGATGGTLDAYGKAITFARPISGEGGMAFKGGGRVTFTVDNMYTGATVVEVGTAVYIPSLNSIAGGFSVTLPETALTDGVYVVLSLMGSDTFSASVLTGLAAPAGGSFVLSGDGKSVLCIVGDPGFVWIGGARGNLSEASNWANNRVPQNGDSCEIGNHIAANLTVGDTFAPSSITFPAGSALVTISGERVLPGLTSIVNNAAQHHVFSCPIDARAATPALPLLEADYLVFSGGIALASMPSVDLMCLAGEWNLDGDWAEPPTGASVLSGSTVNVSGTLQNGYNLVIQEGATLNAANVSADKGTSYMNRFLYMNSGTLTVAGEMLDSIVDPAGASSLAGLFAVGNSSAVTRVNGLVHNASTQGNHPFILNNTSGSVVNTIVLGSGGLSFRNNLGANPSCYPYFQINGGQSVVLASSADWEFGANPTVYDLCLELGGSVIVDTSDYDNRSVAHTIRSLGRIGSEGKMTVKGCGRLLFEYHSDFAGGLDVTETATVAMNVGCAPTRSAISVAGGATLEVAESGTVELKNDLTLADGACLGFNFTENQLVPKLDATGKTVTLGGTVVVKVSAAEGRRGKGGLNVLTSGGKFAGAGVSLAEGHPDWVKSVSVVDGEIAIDVKNKGVALFIR